MSIKSFFNGSKLLFLHFLPCKQWFILYCACLAMITLCCGGIFCGSDNCSKHFVNREESLLLHEVFFWGGENLISFFISTEGKRKRSVWVLWSSLPCCFSPTSIFFSCHRRCLQCRRSEQLHCVSLVYTHTHTWCNAPLLRPPLILCKFHQWVKSLVCCVVHVSCACIPASGSLNISSYVRSTSSETDRERR